MTVILTLCAIVAVLFCGIIIIGGLLVPIILLLQLILGVTFFAWQRPKPAIVTGSPFLPGHDRASIQAEHVRRLPE